MSFTTRCPCCAGGGGSRTRCALTPPPPRWDLPRSGGVPGKSSSRVNTAVSWGCSGCSGTSWGCLCDADGSSVCWPLLGRSWPLSGRFWPLLGRSWPLLGCSWAALGRSWVALGPLWGALGLLLRVSWPLLGRSWPLETTPRCLRKRCECKNTNVQKVLENVRKTTHF